MSIEYLSAAGCEGLNLLVIHYIRMLLLDVYNAFIGSQPQMTAARNQGVETDGVQV